MRALAVACTLLAVSMAGCISTSAPLQGLAVPKAYDTSRAWSVPLVPGIYDVLDGVEAMVPSFDGVEVSVGIFRPSIAGCDWEAAELPPLCRLPAVVDGGPYYGDRVHLDKYRPPTVEWLVPRGYAVLQMALRGTGESRGCMEYKSLKDVEDASAVIDWIASQPWSNGNVGMIGRSYDGTSAWAGAASGNPHLRAIVPISGAIDAPLLYFKNGTTEARAPANGVTYWPNYGLGLTDRADPLSRAEAWPENLCREALVDVHVESDRAALTGDASSPYWQERNLKPRILERYRGALWVIHGLQDYNVNPSQVVPFINEAIDAGIPTRAWLGVWGHAYPDRVDEHRNVRWDWAQQVLEWFDFHLRGQGPSPRLGVEVEDSLFVWRVEQGYPPRDAVLEEFPGKGSGVLAAPGDRLSFATEPQDQALRIAGLPQLAVQVTPSTPVGGNLFAELSDVYPDGRSVRLSWAAINLRYHAGGNTQPRDLTPASPVMAMMEFEPTDALVARGHRLQVVLHRDGVEDIMAGPSVEPLQVDLSASTLRLPIVARPTILPTYAPPGLPPPS